MNGLSALCALSWFLKAPVAAVHARLFILVGPMAIGGFVKVYRSLFDCKIWTKGEFDDAHAYVDLIGMASFAEPDRGLVITSLGRLSSRWGWGTDRKRVRRFLVGLKSSGLIDFKTDKHPTDGGTKIQILAYDLGAKVDPKSATANATANATGLPQQMPQPSTSDLHMENGVVHNADATASATQMPQQVPHKRNTLEETTEEAGKNEQLDSCIHGHSETELDDDFEQKQESLHALFGSEPDYPMSDSDNVQEEGSPQAQETQGTGKPEESVWQLNARTEKERNEEALKLYKAYPMKANQKLAIFEILSALKRGVTLEFLTESVKEYAESEVVKRGFIIPPVNFFKNERYNDDRAVWNKKFNIKPTESYSHLEVGSNAEHYRRLDREAEEAEARGTNMLAGVEGNDNASF